ncbi:MAG TPA: MaoC/PaaZ C-terminal domain-containing protein [Longimicrobiaceae bacterium]
MEALCYEDLADGVELETPARAITVADIEAFAAVSGDRNPLHLDEAYASGTIFGGRIAHGLLGLSVASGLLNASRLTAGTLIAFLGVEWSFRRPIRPGDEVRLRLRVAEARPSRDPGRGVVVFGMELVGAGGEVVQEGTIATLVRRR